MRYFIMLLFVVAVLIPFVSAECMDCDGDTCEFEHCENARYDCAKPLNVTFFYYHETCQGPDGGTCAIPGSHVQNTTVTFYPESIDGSCSGEDYNTWVYYHGDITMGGGVPAPDCCDMYSCSDPVCQSAAAAVDPTCAENWHWGCAELVNPSFPGLPANPSDYEWWSDFGVCDDNSAEFVQNAEPEDIYCYLESNPGGIPSNAYGLGREYKITLKMEDGWGIYQDGNIPSWLDVLGGSTSANSVMGLYDLLRNEYEWPVCGDAHPDCLCAMEDEGAAGVDSTCIGFDYWKSPRDSCSPVHRIQVEMIEIEDMICEAVCYDGVQEGTEECDIKAKQVCTPQDLYNIQDDNSGKYVQVCDIDLEGFPFAPISSFYGAYYGNGYEIRNWQYESTGNVGLFQNLYGALVDVTLVDADLSSTGSYVGGLTGSLLGGKIVNSRVINSSIQGYGGSAGGLAGYMASDGSRILNSAVTGTTVEARRVGGLVGITTTLNQDMLIVGSYADVDIIAADISWAYAGGLVGETRYLAIHNSVAKGSLQTQNTNSDTSIGGIVGILTQNTVITNVYGAHTFALPPDIKHGGIYGSVTNTGNPTIVNTHWDTDVSGVTEACHYVWNACNNPDYNALGRTTAQMTHPYAENTFVDWPFGTHFYVELEEYPQLVEGYVGVSLDDVGGLTDLTCEMYDPVLYAGSDQPVLCADCLLQDYCVVTLPFYAYYDTPTPQNNAVLQENSFEVSVVTVGEDVVEAISISLIGPGTDITVSNNVQTSFTHTFENLEPGQYEFNASAYTVADSFSLETRTVTIQAPDSFCDLDGLQYCLSLGDNQFNLPPYNETLNTQCAGDIHIPEGDAYCVNEGFTSCCQSSGEYCPAGEAP